MLVSNTTAAKTSDGTSSSSSSSYTGCADTTKCSDTTRPVPDACAVNGKCQTCASGYKCDDGKCSTCPPGDDCSETASDCATCVGPKNARSCQSDPGVAIAYILCVALGLFAIGFALMLCKNINDKEKLIEKQKRDAAWREAQNEGITVTSPRANSEEIGENLRKVSLRQQKLVYGMRMNE